MPHKMTHCLVCAALCAMIMLASSAEEQEGDDSLSLDGLRKIVQRFASEFQLDEAQLDVRAT